MTPGRCGAPGRWELDELARELAERELNDARVAVGRDLSWAMCAPEMGQALDRYIAALEARNAIRGGAS